MAAWIIFIDVQHDGVSRAEFSLVEPIPFQAVYIDYSRNPRLLMARLGHEYMDVDSKKSSALNFDFI